jgi:hypothetical protein
MQTYVHFGRKLISTVFTKSKHILEYFLSLMLKQRQSITWSVIDAFECNSCC